MDLIETVKIIQRHVASIANELADDNGMFSREMMLDGMAIVLVESIFATSKDQKEFNDAVKDFIGSVKDASEGIMEKVKEDRNTLN